MSEFRSAPWRKRASVRWLLRIAFATVLPLLLVEGVLRTGAIIVHRVAGGRDRAAGSATQRTVLCVGDSYTYGIGASDAAHSYPAQLERALRERIDSSFGVVNAGWPGRDSWDVLRQLPAQLSQHHPAYVCILAGLNDRWSQPALHQIAAAAGSKDEGGLFGSWRLVRVCRLLRASLADRHEGTPPVALASERKAPHVGAWVDAAGLFRFDADGHAFIHGTEGSWSLVGDRLRLTLADGGTEELALTATPDHLRLSAADGTVRLEGVAAHEHYPVPDDDSRPPDAEAGRALDALYAGDFATAERGLREAVTRFPGCSALHSGLARTFSALQRDDEAAPHVEWLRRRLAEHPSESVAAQLAWALGALTPNREREAELQRLAADHPRCRAAFRALAQVADNLDDVPTMAGAITRALELVDADDPLLRARILRVRARMTKRNGIEQPLKDVWHGYLDDGDRAETLRSLRLLASVRGDSETLATVRKLDLPGPDRARLSDLVAAAVGGGSKFEEVIGSDLRQAVDLCRAVHAEPILLLYPQKIEEQERAVTAVAAATGARVVPVEEAFRLALQHRPHEELFVSDGHCNDAGYALVADRVAAAIQDVEAGH